jgi:hypothetical protein
LGLGVRVFFGGGIPGAACDDGQGTTHLSEVERLLSVEVNALVAKGEDVVLIRELSAHRSECLNLRVKWILLVTVRLCSTMATNNRLALGIGPSSALGGGVEPLAAFSSREIHP